MALVLLGINHNTANIDFRERVAFPPEKVADAIQRATSLPALDELVIVSTCNRTELYCNLDEERQEQVLRWLQQPTQALEAFDLIYADPPYAAGLYGPICRALRDGEWLRPSGLLLLECSSDGVPPLEVGWQLNKQKRYGGSTVLLLQRL